MNSLYPKVQIDALKGKYFSGSSGLILPYKNKTAYPDALEGKSRLEIYAGLFNSIEINSSFYKIPRFQTIEKWAGSVPENFRFTFKVWQGITHNKGLAYSDESVFQFMHAVSAIGHKKGCLLIQLPPSLTSASLPAIKGLILQMLHVEEIMISGTSGKLLPFSATNRWQLSIEFRHPSWYSATTIEELEYLGVNIVLHDKTQAPFSSSESHGDIIYLRFHGPDGNYRGSYSRDFLYEYATYINDWLADDKQVYAYFNNTMGEAYANLTRLNQDLKELFRT